MGKPRQKKADDLLLAALANGANVDNAARKAGVTVRTVYRRLADPEFCRRVDQTRRDNAQRLSDLTTAASHEGLRTLLNLQDSSTPASVRYKAAMALLEMGRKFREEADLGQRVTALEEAQGQQPPTREERF